MPDDYEEVLVVLIVGITICIVLTGIIVFIMLFYQKKRFQDREQLLEVSNRYNEQLLHSRIEVQEQTLNVIGQELHDNIGQLLSSAIMLLGYAERSLISVPESLKSANDTIIKAVNDLRELSKSFSSEWLQQFNLIENLRNELGRINSAGNMRANLDASIDIIPFSSEVQVIIFRIIQEALQNVLKHSDARNILVVLKQYENRLKIKVQDDGKGFETDGASNGLGTINMRTRTGLLGGTIYWDSDTSNGTQVSIEIPVQIYKS